MQKSWALGLVVLCAVLASCKGDPLARQAARLEKGDRYLAEDKLAEALIEYQSAVQLNDRNGTARQKLGRALVRAGNMNGATEQLVRAADLLPTDVGAQLEAAQALLRVGRIEDARTRAEGVIMADPKNIDALLLRAAANAGLRDPAGAMTTLEEVLKLEPGRSEAQVNLAALLAAGGRGAEAEAGFKRAVALNPQAPISHLALANYYLVTGRANEAEQALVAGVAAIPADARLNRALASLYLVLGRTNEAEGPLKRVAETQGTPQARLMLADYYIRQRRPEEARAILVEVSKQPGAEAAARARLAGIEYETGRPAEGHRLIDALIAEQPSNAQIRVVKGEWLLREGKPDEARSHAEGALKIDPKSADAMALLGAVHLVQGRSDEAEKAYREVLQLRPGSVSAQVALAELSLARGRNSEAAELARQAIRGDARNGAARLLLARALLAQGNIQEADAELKPVLEAAKDLAPVQTLAGQIRARRGDAPGARQAFERALAADPRAADALAGLANLDLAAKRPRDAAQRVEAQLAKVPDSPGLLLVAGRTYAMTGDLVRSETALRKAIDTDPSFMEAYHVLGQIFVRQNKLDDARQAYEQRLQQRPDDVGAHTMVGMILLTQGKAAEARARFEKTITIEPRAAVALNNLAYFDAEAGTNLDVALGRAQTAKSILPDDPDVNDTLGWIYVRRGLASLALPPLELAVRKSPQNPIFLYHLGMAQLGVKDNEGARRSLERALALSQTFPGAQEAKSALAGIGR